jgi:hypothetical protein
LILPKGNRGGGFRDFVHYPIKLAWAITVHKRGLTFDKAAIDVSQVLCPAGLCCIIAFALVRRADFAISVAYEWDQDVMDYSLNKASEELLKNLCILKLRISFIII